MKTRTRQFWHEGPRTTPEEFRAKSAGVAARVAKSEAKKALRRAARFKRDAAIANLVRTKSFEPRRDRRIVAGNFNTAKG